MDKDPFLHCLRAQIYPDEYADERIDSLKDFCLRYGFKNIILIFNGEEHNVGHISDEELVKWVKLIKRAKKEFAEVGISTSLNPWMELGHLDRGRKLQKGQDFMTMVDRFGKASELVACPLDEKWKEYYLHQLSYYVGEIKPEVLWIEDDFRYHNHPPLDYGGCFCEKHMEAYNEHLLKKESREEFVSNLAKGEPNEERKVWLDISSSSILTLAKDIAKTVEKASPFTHIGLMSSLPLNHAMEARDWGKLHKAFAYDDVAIDRIHLPAYREAGSKPYYFDFNRISMVARSFIGDDCYIYPELENSSFSLFVKDPKFVAFQLESALPLGISGMTYNIFAHCGNGAQEEFGYGEVIKELTPYLNRVKEERILPSEMRGIVFPLFEDTVYHANASTFLDLVPKEFDILGYFSSMGFSYRISKKKRFFDEVVAISGENIRNFSDEELVSLFKENFVLLDGKAAYILKERGLGNLINLTRAEYRGAYHEYDAFEMYEGEETIDGMHHYKATSQRRAGDYYSFLYSADTKIVSGLYDARMNRTGNGVAIGKHFFIYPYEVKGSEDTAFFMPMRRYIFEHYLLDKLKKPFAKSMSDGVYSYLYERDDSYLLLMTNANYCSYKEIAFELFNASCNKIVLLGKDGKSKEVAYTKKENKIIIEEPFPYLSTVTLILPK